MVLWWKDFFRNWKINLFMIVQIMFVFVLVNEQITNLVYNYKSLSFAEEKGSGLYIYQNSMGTLLKGEYSWQAFEKAEHALYDLDGVESVGYQIDSIVEVEGYINERDPEWSDVSFINMNALMWESLQYRLEEGEWFNKTYATDKELQVIIGGDMSEKFDVGDRISIHTEKGTKEAVIIGDLGRDYFIFEFNLWGVGQTFTDNADTMGDVILANDVALMEELKDVSSYPAYSALIKIKEGTDLKKISKYGRLVSFDKMAENTEKQLEQFVWQAIKDNAIWIMVIIFGVAGTSYLIAKKRRYQWGVYLLLGVSGDKLLRNMMLEYAITYLIGSLGAFVLYIATRDIVLDRLEYTIENWIATIILYSIMFAMALLCNFYIKRIEPKEILTQTKE